MSAAGPPQGRLREGGEAQARSARPRALAAADRELLRWSRDRNEAARPLRGKRRAAPHGGHHTSLAGGRRDWALDGVCAMIPASTSPGRPVFEAHFPRLRAADRRPANQDRRAALCARGFGGRHFRRDQPPGQEESAADQGDLLETVLVADRAGGTASPAPLLARLYRRHV